MKHNITIFVTATALVVLGFIFWETDVLYYVLGGVVVLHLVAVIYGSLTIQSNYFLTSINKCKKKSISLTFDDGPDPDTTPKILDILAEKGVKATFFVIGKKAAARPDLVRRIISEGHIVGNHSYSHSYFLGFFSKSRLQADIEKANQILVDIIGKKTLYFRPPFGVTNPRYARVLKALGMTSIGWSLRSLDTKAKTKYQLIDRVLTNITRKDIVLLHDNQRVTLDALEDIIEHFKQKGLKMESLPEVIDIRPYEEN